MYSLALTVEPVKQIHHFSKKCISRPSGCTFKYKAQNLFALYNIDNNFLVQRFRYIIMLGRTHCYNTWNYKKLAHTLA